MDLTVFGLYVMGATVVELEFVCTCSICNRYSQREKGFIAVFSFNNTYQRVLTRTRKTCPACGAEYLSVTFFPSKNDADAAISQCTNLIANAQVQKEHAGRLLDDLLPTLPPPFPFEMEVSLPHMKCDS
jgi:hypothetical protein